MVKVKIGKFTVKDEDFVKPESRWEIVNEIGVGRWLGAVVEEAQPCAYHSGRLTLQPALEMSSPSRTPSLMMSPSGGPVVAVAAGFGTSFVLDQPSDHPVRDLQYSSRQKVCEMSEDLQTALFNQVVNTVEGEPGPDGKRHRRH